MPSGNFSKFGTKVHLDSRVNWLDFGRQRSGTWILIMSKSHTNVCKVIKLWIDGILYPKRFTVTSYCSTKTLFWPSVKAKLRSRRGDCDRIPHLVRYWHKTWAPNFKPCWLCRSSGLKMCLKHPVVFEAFSTVMATSCALSDSVPCFYRWTYTLIETKMDQFYCISMYHKWHTCLMGLYNLYSKWHPLSWDPWLERETSPNNKQNWRDSLLCRDLKRARLLWVQQGTCIRSSYRL